MAEVSDEYLQEVAQAGMVFRVPPDFDLVPTQVNDRFRYACAVSSRAVKLEIRYQIFPLKLPPMPDGFTRIASVDLNQLHVPNLLAMIENISSRVVSGPNRLPDDAVQAEFGADWGVVCRLELATSGFAGGFAECMLVSLHKEDFADAQVLYLFDDFEAVKGVLQGNFYTLRFAAPELGVCPSCESTIPLAALECPKCKALFGPGAAWKVTPMA